jgi:ubiquinone biosynthesis protein UbiJ
MLLGVIEILLNRSIADSSLAAGAAERVSGKSMAVQVDGLGVRALLRVTDRRVALSLDPDAQADAVLKGRPLELMRLLGPGPDSLGRLRDADVDLSGDMRVAEGFSALLQAAAPDLEEALSGWVGDIPAHALGRRFRSLAKWSARAVQALEADTAEFLHEETAALPRPEQVRAFCGEVDRLRDDVERAAARLERLGRLRAAGS